ncbi:MAG: ABC transporter substrate-binding protein [Bacteroidota bacterium]
MNRSIYYLIFIILFASCSRNSTPEQAPALGGKSYGGTFRFMSLEKVSALFPISSSDIYSQRLNTQIFESLFRESTDNKQVAPHLVESYTKSADGLIYTFSLRKGVEFHEDACFKDKTRELTAKDVAFVLQFACSKSELNHLSHLLVSKIVGSEEYFNKKTKTISGIKVIDSHKLSISLTQPFSNFEKLLSHPSLGMFPEEALKKYGNSILTHPVGTGPFVLDKITENSISLRRNNNYWRKDKFGNSLPFLAQIEMKYGKDKNSELKAFQNNEIDIILNVPTENVINLFGSLNEAQKGKNQKHKVYSRKSSRINYLAFSTQHKPFDDILVRKAFLNAIDVSQVTNDVLMGEGLPATKGFIPEINGYVADTNFFIEYNPQKAKALLSQAGYPSGEGFPQLTLWVNTLSGTSTNLWTENISEQLKKNLNIDVKIKLCSFNERQEAIKKGDAVFWKTGWIADYPDPESFVSVFYQKYSQINPFWGNVSCLNKNFDNTYISYLLEKNANKRNDYLNKCNQFILDEAIVLPIYFEDLFVVYNLKVRDFTVNSIETMDLSSVYLKEL